MSRSLFDGDKDLGHHVPVAQDGVGFFDVFFDEKVGAGDFFAAAYEAHAPDGGLFFVGNVDVVVVDHALDFVVCDEARNFVFGVDGASTGRGVFEDEFRHFFPFVGEDAEMMALHGVF